jgi:type I restriction enzyme, S subunit
MKGKPLSSLVSNVRQCNPLELGRTRITYFDISCIDNRTKRLMAPQRIAVDAAPSRARQLVQADDVLVSTVRPNLNAVALVPAEFDGEIASTGFCVLRPQPKQLCPEYLFYFTQSAGFVRHLSTIATGASYPAVTDGDILDTCIPLPTLPEQQRIAAQLQQADRLRRTRQHAIELTDTFLPAAFLERFGNPIRNSERWPTIPLSEVCDNITDGTHDTPERVRSGVPFLTSKNIRPFEFDLTELEFVTEETHREIIKRCNPRFGDVLYTNIGVNVGNAVANRLGFEFSLKNVALIQPDFSKLDAAFLEALLNNSSFKKKILRCASVGGAQKFVSLELLRGIEIVVPPLTLQQTFASVVERVQYLLAVQREAVRQADHLFQSLLHDAFRREQEPSHAQSKAHAV